MGKPSQSTPTIQSFLQWHPSRLGKIVIVAGVALVAALISLPEAQAGSCPSSGVNVISGVIDSKQDNRKGIADAELNDQWRVGRKV